MYLGFADMLMASVEFYILLELSVLMRLHGGIHRMHSVSRTQSLFAIL